MRHRLYSDGLGNKYEVVTTLHHPLPLMPSLNFTTDEDPLSLDRIRSVLVRLEDTIIFSLIERAQFAHNPRIYQRAAFQELTDLGFRGSWLEWFLKETETFHGLSRYLSCNCYFLSSDWDLHATQQRPDATQGECHRNYPASPTS
jgi:hypothetical protein